jgi:sialic acid synthase SpsE|tara:strand:- start:272 stop:394 length:123 start_codon:yes stop_codon:yes gene_type:complete
MKFIKINKKISINNHEKPLLVTEISANHAGNKNNFLCTYL